MSEKQYHYKGVLIVRRDNGNYYAALYHVHGTLAAMKKEINEKMNPPKRKVYGKRK